MSAMYWPAITSSTSFDRWGSRIGPRARVPAAPLTMRDLRGRRRYMPAAPSVLCGHVGDAGDGQQHPTDAFHVVTQQSLHTLAAPAHESSDEEETCAAADDRSNDKWEQRHGHGPGGNGEYLVRNGCESGNEDRPHPPIAEPLHRAFVRGPIPRRLYPGRDEVERPHADEVTEQAAPHRCHRGLGRVKPGSVALGECHRRQHHIGRDRKKDDSAKLIMPRYQGACRCAAQCITRSYKAENRRITAYPPAWAQSSPRRAPRRCNPARCA